MPPPSQDLRNKLSLSQNTTKAITVAIQGTNLETEEQVKRQKKFAGEDMDEDQHPQLTPQQSEEEGMEMVNVETHQ